MEAERRNGGRLERMRNYVRKFSVSQYVPCRFFTQTPQEIVHCEEHNRDCENCGWNPEVIAERMKKIENEDFMMDEKGRLYLKIYRKPPVCLNEENQL